MPRWRRVVVLAALFCLALCATPHQGVVVVCAEAVEVDVLGAEDDALLRETMLEWEREAQEEARMREEEARDGEVAAAAEARAREEEAQRAREEEEARRQAAGAETGQATSRKNRAAFFRASGGHAGASALRQNRQDREPVDTAGRAGAGGDGGGRRSRVPRSSLGGQAASGAGATAGGEQGNPFVGDGSTKTESFDEMNERLAEMQRRFSPEDRAYKEDPSRRAAREALDADTRKRQAQEVQRVLRAEDRDYYRILGLRRGCREKSKIKQEYRARVLLIHPDKNLDLEAPRAFDILQQAYETLADDTARAEYDRFLRKKGRVRRQRVVRRLVEAYQGASELGRYGWTKSGVLRSAPALLVFCLVLF